MKAGDVLREVTTDDGHNFVVVVGFKRATQLSSAGDTLADRTIVFHTSHQLDWFYVQGITPDGRFVRRRYRHDRMVAVEEWLPAPSALHPA